jgi:NAD/NADP transhydrogenase beta subunit
MKNVSWRTTSVGWIGLAMAIMAVVEGLIKGEPITDTQWGLIGSLLVANVGLVMAKDSKVTGLPQPEEKQ